MVLKCVYFVRTYFKPEDCKIKVTEHIFDCSNVFGNILSIKIYY